MVVLGLLQKGMWRIKMKTKLKALQILEVMLNKNRKVRAVSESDNTVFDGEDWVSIDEAITELRQQEQLLYLKSKDLLRLNYIFNGEISRCGNCGELKRRGFGCYCGDEDE